MSVVKKLKTQKRDESYVFGSIVGLLVGIDQQGKPLVNFEKNGSGLAEAKSALSLEDCAAIKAFPVDVLLCFENGDLSKPIISGLIREHLFPLSKNEKEDSKKDKCLHAEVDGKSVTLSARDEIKLQCGKSSILLRKDGKIVVKGSNLISRSTASNKIKGGSVSIN